MTINQSECYVLVYHYSGAFGEEEGEVIEGVYLSKTVAEADVRNITGFGYDMQTRYRIRSVPLNTRKDQ